MLFNVPESDPEEKKKDDLEFLRILMSEIKLTVPFSQVIRIGVAEKTHGKARPMRARTTCITDQRNIVKAASILFRRIQKTTKICISRKMRPL